MDLSTYNGIYGIFNAVRRKKFVAKLTLYSSSSTSSRSCFTAHYLFYGDSTILLIFQARQALFEWFLDAPSSMKARLSMKISLAKANEFYNIWLCQQEDKVPEEKHLEFSKLRIKGWMNQCGVSLRKPNKRSAISKTEMKVRIIQFLKNVWRVRYWFKSKFGREIPIINGDQMPFH